MTEIDKVVPEIEARAQILAECLPLASRAFVIEFAGTPKSGKSTTVEAIRHFFARSGFRVHVLIERASICPIPMKGHLFFNTWCASTMLSELLEEVDTDTDIIIVDRGIFDALVWLTMQKDRGELTSDEFHIIEAFFLMDRWRGLIDLAVVMNVDPEEAIRRENSQRISARIGSIMNEEVLGRLSESVRKAARTYGPKFDGIIEHETSGMTIRESAAKLATQILDRLEEFLSPEILVVPRREVERLPVTNGGNFAENADDIISKCIADHGEFVSRSRVESNDEYVQIIAAGLLTHEEQVFLFRRKERDPKYALYGKETVWQGAHVPKTPGVRGVPLLEQALLDRIKRNLFLSRGFGTRLVGYCWDVTDARESRHVGVIFRVDIDNREAAIDLRKKEFRRGRGHGLAGGFVNWSQLAQEADSGKLEPWSLAILRHFHSRQVQHKDDC